MKTVHGNGLIVHVHDEPSHAELSSTFLRQEGEQRSLRAIRRRFTKRVPLNYYAFMLYNSESSNPMRRPLAGCELLSRISLKRCILEDITTAGLRGTAGGKSVFEMR